ncbi:zinc finger protein 135-like isoform X2 [Bactrocera tryoni]|uniref:zinc finger protein 135-like isoform X2 n=1 Tax=Bactrocera tryoni TaxID=59916 RepID=UPI001A98FC91|nr:zinc finger protein 135-like isoform X2 [Bactrocera tryoni]
MEFSEISANYDRICRLCGEEQHNLIELTGKNNEDINSLVKRTLGFLNIKYKENDSFPNCLCVACHLDAESTDKFLQMVKEGQRKLTQKLRKDLVAGKNGDVSQLKDKNLCMVTKEMNHETIEGENLNDGVRTTGARLVNSTSISKYAKRVRKKKKRFPCDPSPYIEGEQIDVGLETNSDNSSEINTGTLITIQPIAELRSANGSSLAEIISVDSDAPMHQSTPTKPEIRMICEYCKEVFTKQHIFLKHLRTHNKSLYKCLECISKFDNLTNLKEHHQLTGHKGTTLLTKTDNESNEKQTPDKKSETTINIVVDDEGHITSINSDLNATSKENGETANSPLYVAENIEQVRSVSSPKTSSFKCLKCNKSYKTHYSVLRHHKQVHIATRPYKCQHCTATFKNSTNLTYHMAKHTGIRNFKCNICAKAFVHKSELTLHMRTHTGDKPYVCKHCSKGFSHRSNMVTHMRLHSGQLPFKCETCSANFNSSSHWKLHKQMHLKHAQRAVLARLQDNNAKIALSSDKHEPTVDASSTQTYDSVQKSNATTSLLRSKVTNVQSVEVLPSINTLPDPSTVISKDKLERLILTNIPMNSSAAPGATQLRFKCDQCLQRFKLKSALTKHLRTHTGERPYKCPFCPRTFADASNFKRHKTLHKTATEELQNVTKKYKSSDLLHEFQRDRRKALPVGSISPTHSVASDPDPDGLEALQLASVPSPKSVSDADTVFDMLHSIAGETKRQISSSNDTIHTTSGLNTSHRPAIPKSPQRLICISYPNPANPSDNKMTTFYV